MKLMKSLFALLTLAVMLAFGAGCAKQEAAVDVPSSDPNRAAIEAAAQQIAAGTIYFDFDKYDIKSEYRQVLQQNADLMKKYSSIRVRVEGHCDARGTEEYNLALGERRASAVSEYMVRLGVPAGQLETISFGKSKPAVSGNGEKAWSKNRRDEFNVIAK